MARTLHLPTENETLLAKEASRKLSTLHPAGDDAEVKIRSAELQLDISLPTVALEMLMEMLTQMAQGNAVTIIPYHAELSTQQAADLLNVSRPYLIKLIDQGYLPCKMVGRHRRIRFEDLRKYKDDIDAARRKSLDKLTKSSQSLGIGYD